MEFIVGRDANGKRKIRKIEKGDIVKIMREEVEGKKVRGRKKLESLNTKIDNNLDIANTNEIKDKVKTNRVRRNNIGIKINTNANNVNTNNLNTNNLIIDTSNTNIDNNNNTNKLDTNEIIDASINLDTNNEIKNEINNNIEETPIVLSEEQLKVLDLMNSGENVFITGDAGTGKSTLINYFCKHTDKKIIRCAPTAVAAKLVGGATLHSTFRIPLELFTPTSRTDSRKILETLSEAEVIVIDEISMVRSDVFQYIWNTLKLATSIPQIIAVGDFSQLPPVVTRNEEDTLLEIWGNDFNPFCFTSEAWKEIEFKNVVLHQVFRQKDIEFLENLQKIKICDITGLDYFNHLNKRNKKKIADLDNKFAINIVPTNQRADDINYAELQKLDGRAKVFHAIIDGKYQGQPAPKELKLKKGCRVVALINKRGNSSSLEYCNGDFGTIIELNNSEIRVKWDNGNTSNIEKYIWEEKEYSVIESKFGEKQLIQNTIGSYVQYPLRVAYAVTVHKSQGQTYEAANIIGGMFVHGQLYVALSRVRSPEGLRINGRIFKGDLKSDESVTEFLKSLERKSKKKSDNKIEINFSKDMETSKLVIPSKYKKKVIKYINKLIDKELMKAS